MPFLNHSLSLVLKFIVLYINYFVLFFTLLSIDDVAKKSKKKNSYFLFLQCAL